MQKFLLVKGFFKTIPGLYLAQTVVGMVNL